MKRIAWINPSSGLSGDMFLGALIDLGADRKVLEEGLRRLPLPGVSLSIGEVRRGGLRALKCTPSFSGREAKFLTLGKVKEALRESSLDRELITGTEKVFQRLAEAEGDVHGRSAGTVHFHELGSADTIVDVVGTLIAWRQLGIAEGYSTAVNTGSGEITCAHGILPVPAPATAQLLRGWPVFSDGEKGEKTTPTGAALLTHLCRPVDVMPPVTLEKTGYGAGERDFDSRPNSLQIHLALRGEPEVQQEEVIVMETNLDDLNPQIFGSLISLLLEKGAIEAFVTPVVMKKGRPGHLLTVIGHKGSETGLGALIFRETGTLGYRVTTTGRMKLSREILRVQTPLGAVRVKTASFGGETIRWAPEYEDCRRLAEKSGRPVREVIEEVLRIRGGD